MKLLVIDDEKLTRDGLVENIDWKSLGISSVTQADDGVHGYEVALDFHPDIILSDVRMPRMTGIEMAERLQDLNPGLSIIFMSGFSDKEYLKAAIKLKAVSYVEKPIDLAEIEEAVREARQRAEEAKKAASSQELSLSRARSMLASALISAQKGEMEVFHGADLDFPVDGEEAFFTFLIRFSNRIRMQDELEDGVASLVGGILARQHLKEIHFIRQERLIFFHVWGFPDYSDSQKKMLGGMVAEALERMGLKFHIVFGKNVSGARQIHDSYNSAVMELQNAFFAKENTCSIYRHVDSYAAIPDLGGLDTAERLAKMLARKDGAAEALMDRTLETLVSGHNMLPNQVRDFYYKLFATVKEAYQTLHIYSGGGKEGWDGLWGYISDCESIYPLHGLLMEKIRQFLSQAESHAEGNASIYLIKEFIAAHYMEESLSIKVISKHVFLSPSYLCTLFKSETGQTLNQYLTDFRMEKAKKLLRDPRYRIADISAQIGYGDGNYFGKIFKKSTGMSPSEYRERETRDSDG